MSREATIAITVLEEDLELVMSAIDALPGVRTVDWQIEDQILPLPPLRGIGYLKPPTSTEEE